MKFGGGKVIRDGMGQSQRVGRAVRDLVITNALVVATGHRQGRQRHQGGGIVAVGKAGNPDVQPAWIW